MLLPNRVVGSGSGAVACSCRHHGRSKVCEGTLPQRGVLSERRATPWGTWVERVSALKGRTRAIGRLARPFRASAGVCATVSQGVALRSDSTPLWGRHNVSRTTRLLTGFGDQWFPNWSAGGAAVCSCRSTSLSSRRRRRSSASSRRRSRKSATGERGRPPRAILRPASLDLAVCEGD